MSHFDDLPRRDRGHDIEEEAIIAFQRRLSESRVFILPGAFGHTRDVLAPNPSRAVPAGRYNLGRGVA
jgi:hypothetical protein